MKDKILVGSAHLWRRAMFIGVSTEKQTCYQALRDRTAYRPAVNAPDNGCIRKKKRKNRL